MNQQSHVLPVLIPAFNEEQTILRVLRSVLALGSLLKEIIVIDDGSQDRTTELGRNP
jgi:glycosyltransferase involved in cell wall biosynthesis